MADESVSVQEKAAPVASEPAPAPVPAEQVVSDNEVDEKIYRDNSASIEDHDEPEPRLHAKTWLTVFAVCLIYFAQLINVVGAGAVSFLIPKSRIGCPPDHFSARTRHCKGSRRCIEQYLAHLCRCHLHHRPLSPGLPSGRLLGPPMVSHPSHSLRCHRLYHRCARKHHEHGHCWTVCCRNLVWCPASPPRSHLRGAAPKVQAICTSRR